MNPQVGVELEEKVKFWSPRGETVVIGADFNRHVGAGNRGEEEVMGRFGIRERNTEGQTAVGFEKRMEKAVVNTFLQKRE